MNVLLPLSDLKEAVRCSEAFISTCKLTRCYCPQEQARHIHCGENLKSQLSFELCADCTFSKF